MTPTGYVGPRLVLSSADAARIMSALHGAKDAAALAVTAKCIAVLNADPSWDRPLR